MANVAISGDTSGAVTLTVPAAAGTQTATFPAATGTVMVSGNMPAFRAYKSTDQTGLTSNVATKVTFDTVVFDTNSNYSTANSRFTPTVAGYYMVNAQIIPVATAMTNQQFAIYKNGAENANIYYRSTVSDFAFQNSALVVMNGSTDYIEIYTKITGASGIYVASGNSNCWFSAVLVRTA